MRILLFLLIMTFSTAKAQTPLPSDRNGDGKVKIGALIKNDSNPYFRTMREGYEFAAARYNVEIIVGSTPSEDAADEQLAILESWLNEGDFDGFIVTPFRAVSLNSALITATERGIPIINIDELIPADALDGIDLSAQIASNNVRAGDLAGVLLLGRIPFGSEVAIIEGAPGTTSSIDRVTGFHDFVTSAGYTVVASQTANWDRSEAFNVATNILQGNPNVKAIFAANDGMGLGAVEAVDAADLTGQVIVVSVDAIPEALDSVRQGKLAGTVAQYPDEMAILAVEAMLKVLQGRPITPRIELPLVMITSENVETAGSRLGDPVIGELNIGLLMANFDDTFDNAWLNAYTTVALDLGIEFIPGSPQPDSDEDWERWYGEAELNGWITTSNVILPGSGLTVVIDHDAPLTEATEYIASVSTDSYLTGKSAGEFILSQVESGSKVALLGDASEEASHGFIEAIGSDLTILPVATIEELEPDISAIFASTWNMSEAIIEAELTDKVIVVNHISPEMYDALKAEKISGIVILDFEAAAYLAVESLIKAIEGRPVVSIIHAPTMILTRENLPE